MSSSPSLNPGPATTLEFKDSDAKIVARVHMTVEEVDDLIRVLLKWRSEHVSVTESAS